MMSLFPLGVGWLGVMVGSGCSQPVPGEPSFAMRGIYSYMADATIFMECQTGRKLSVALEGNNLSLERAYLKVRQ
jgi:uncharacterized lipoprotein NlpE involved in copper resistance